MDEGISLEETNRIRIELGLAPLTDDGDAPVADDMDREAEENYARKREQEAKERQRKYVSPCNVC